MTSKLPALRDNGHYLIGSPHTQTKAVTPAIADAAPERSSSSKRARRSSEDETPRPSSSRKLTNSSGSRNVDVFMEKAGITPDSEGNTYTSNTFNFNHMTNQFQKNIFQNMRKVKTKRKRKF